MEASCVYFGWGYTHDHRADKDSYPHDRNVTDDLCSWIKLCLAFMHLLWLFFQLTVLLLFMLKIIYFKKCLNHLKLKKKVHNRHRQKREKQVIDHSTGDKN